MDAKTEIAKLTDELRRHGKAYYDLDAPTISDFEYDALMRRLIELEEQFPELNRPIRQLRTSAEKHFRSFRPCTTLYRLKA